MKFWKVAIDSRNFSFEAYGISKGDAVAAFTLGIGRHQEQYPGVSAEWVLGMIAEANEVAREIDVGAAYRDGEVLACASRS